MNVEMFGTCPMPKYDYDRILLGHGSGGGLSADLIKRVFLPEFKNEIKKSYILGDPSQTPVSLVSTNGIRCLKVDRNNEPHATAYTVCLEISGDKVER